MEVININNLKKGFTLIELLVVIAVLGVLATVVIVAINPFEQLAKGRDSGRLSTTAQLGQADVSYSVANNGAFVTANPTWVTSLQKAGEISIIPATITYSNNNNIGQCNLNNQNNMCYNSSSANGPIVVYSRLESTSNNSRCLAPNTAAWAVYSSADGRGGVVCTNGAEPTPGNQTFLP